MRVSRDPACRTSGAHPVSRPVVMQSLHHRILIAALTGLALSPGEAGTEERPSAIDFEEGRRFWSFQPLRRGDPPPRAGWRENRIDDFIDLKLRKQGLEPSGEASRRVQIRRLSYDLTGLPPSPSEVESFLSDQSPEAYLRLVDRLLSSPHYGERWARAWLDLARYTDVRERWIVTHGNPYRYRDWVVRALNADMSYDQFVRRQLATDLMEETGVEDMPALGFLGVSPVYHKELLLAPEVIRTIVAEEWEERVDAVGRTFLGLTISCARCHDHKSDPIDTADYYALAGVFASIRRADRASGGGERARVADKARKEVARL